MTPNEKRRAHRRYTTGVLEFYDEGGVFMTGFGRLLDLSVTGGLVETATQLKIGQVLRLSLRLDGQEPMDLLAKVVRVVEKGTQIAYGIQFGNLSSKELAQIKNLL